MLRYQELSNNYYKYQSNKRLDRKASITDGSCFTSLHYKLIV